MFVSSNCILSIAVSSVTPVVKVSASQCVNVMYSRVKLVLLICSSACLLFMLAFNCIWTNKIVKKYSYLNVVQQSFSYEYQDEEIIQSNSADLLSPDVDRILYGDFKACKVRKKIIFAKTHKTGSTTLQNIFHRFGEQNSLLFVLPKSGHHYFGLKTPFTIDQADLYSMFKNVR